MCKNNPASSFLRGSTNNCVHIWSKKLLACVQLIFKMFRGERLCLSHEFSWHVPNAHVPVKKKNGWFCLRRKMASGHAPILDLRTQYLRLSAVSLSPFFFRLYFRVRLWPGAVKTNREFWPGAGRLYDRNVYCTSLVIDPCIEKQT